MKVINFFVKGLAKTNVSASKDGSNPVECDRVQWFPARYEVKSGQAYFLRDGGLTKGAAITLSDSMKEAVLAMDQTTV